MATKRFHTKPIYFVWLINKKTKGLGMQPVKADNKKEANKKFKKRFPHSSVIDIKKADKNIDNILKQNAI